MSSRKASVYKISKSNNIYEEKDNSTEFFVGIVVYAIVLMITSSLFEGFYVQNFLFALIAALLLSLLNTTIKPLLVVLTLPLNIVTLGIAYPIVNVIILQFCDLLMGKTFDISGIFAPFVIAVFISFLKIVLDNLITKKVGR